MVCACRPKSFCAGAIRCNARTAASAPKPTLMNFTDIPAVVLIVADLDGGGLAPIGAARVSKRISIR